MQAFPACQGLSGSSVLRINPGKDGAWVSRRVSTHLQTATLWLVRRPSSAMVELSLPRDLPH